MTWIWPPATTSLSDMLGAASQFPIVEPPLSVVPPGQKMSRLSLSRPND